MEKRTREVLAKAEAETKELLSLERAKRLLAVSEMEDEANARFKEQEEEQVGGALILKRLACCFSRWLERAWHRLLVEKP